MKTSDESYIWISRWDGRDGFQHYKPERDRPPAWIKHYTKQLRDARYLRLSDRQRALLVDLRCIFAVTMMELPYDQKAISLHRQMRTYSADLEALNHAGFIQVISREVLDENLERVYSSPARARDEEKEVEEESPNPPDGGNLTCRNCGESVRPRSVCRNCGANPRVAGSNPRAATKPRVPFEGSKELTRALAFTRNAGHQYEPLGFEEELARYGLAAEEHEQVKNLYATLRTNGNEPQEELPWEGEEPPVVAG